MQDKNQQQNDNKCRGVAIFYKKSRTTRNTYEIGSKLHVFVLHLSLFLLCGVVVYLNKKGVLT